MALPYSTPGISSSGPVPILVLCRSVVLCLPLLAGILASQHPATEGAAQRRRFGPWGVRIAAVLVALMGVINVLSAVTPSLAGRVRLLQQISPLEVRHGGHLTAALAGFALLALARGLARRKHVAWLLTLAVLAISIASHLIKGLDYEEASVAGALMLMLWLMRSHFHARSDRPSIQQGLRVLAGALLFTVAYGVAGFYLLDRHYTVNFGLWAALQQTVVMFTEFYDPGLTPITGFGRFFADSIYLVGAVTLAYAGLMLLRPVIIRGPATDAERARARSIVEQHARSALGRPLLFDDKRYFFTDGGSVIGYVLSGRAAVTLGDPVGPPDDIRAAIDGFLALCGRNDWMPVFYETMPSTLEHYKRPGLNAVSIGEEGIVDLASFTLEGGRAKALRAPFNKLSKAGFTFQVHDPPIQDRLLDELRQVSDEWLTTRGAAEMRFSLGWFDDEYIRGSPIGAVHAPQGWIAAFANLVPEYQLNEITIDLMRHRQPLENGTMEFLFASLFQWAKSLGYGTFNLGLSSLAGVGQKAGDPAIERVMHWVYENVDQFYNFKGLHAFKEKFSPQWSPRYLIYPGVTNLPQAWLAVVNANTGGRLLRLPFRGPRASPRGES